MQNSYNVLVDGKITELFGRNLGTTVMSTKMSWEDYLKVWISGIVDTSRIKIVVENIITFKRIYQPNSYSTR